MKTKKINFASIQGKLSRTEMTKIMAGSGGDCQTDGEPCSSVSGRNCCEKLNCTNYKCGRPT